MKANELMVGDWVISKKRGKDEILQVVTIDGGTNTVWLDGDSYSGLVKDDDIFPIPLTKEILENNGFKYEYGDSELYSCDVYAKECDGLNITVIFNKFAGWFYRVIDQKTKFTRSSGTSPYLHTLQNIISIGGIKEEIEL